jgi:phosphate/phosphite/phosphonate ABC transporter binding protein
LFRRLVVNRRLTRLFLRQWPPRTLYWLAIIVLTGPSLSGADRPITIGVVIDERTQKEREALRAYLAKAMERPVDIETPDTYRDTVAHLADGSYDLACLGALMYIRAHTKNGVIPPVRRTVDLQYHSLPITGAGSSIYSLSDLRGKQFSLGDRDSTSGHLVAYYELQQAEIPDTDSKFRFRGSHPATAAMVGNGVVDGGAIDGTVFRRLAHADFEFKNAETQHTRGCGVGAETAVLNH